MIQNIAFAHLIKYNEFDTDLLDQVSEDCVKESEEVDMNVKKFHSNESKMNHSKFKESRKKLDLCMSKAEEKLHHHEEDVKVSSF